MFLMLTEIPRARPSNPCLRPSPSSDGAVSVGATTTN